MDPKLPGTPRRSIRGRKLALSTHTRAAAYLRVYCGEKNRAARGARQLLAGAGRLAGAKQHVAPLRVALDWPDSLSCMYCHELLPLVCLHAALLRPRAATRSMSRLFAAVARVRCRLLSIPPPSRCRLGGVFFFVASRGGGIFGVDRIVLARFQGFEDDDGVRVVGFFFSRDTSRKGCLTFDFSFGIDSFGLFVKYAWILILSSEMIVELRKN